MAKLVAVFRKYFSENKMLLEESFQYDASIFQNEKVFYKDIEADKIIFCEGYAAMHNPLWKHLPFLPAKGEIITIKRLGVEYILQRKPSRRSLYGATRGSIKKDLGRPVVKWKAMQ